MKLFTCPVCSNPLFFENDRCLGCGSQVGFDPGSVEFLTLDGRNFCDNHPIIQCNWLAESPGQLCQSCALNRKVPAFSDRENVHKWSLLEIAKRRLIYQLNRLKLPLTDRRPAAPDGLIFDFLTPDNQENAVTGHANGIITIILSEADSVYREQMRVKMSESYRTLIGHFRHEVGHYFWDILFTGQTLERFRRLFGDERADYGESLQRYYREGAPEGWENTYITRYATSHPWEDWAETWAHYLHLMDTLETAYYFGIGLHPRIADPAFLATEQSPDPYRPADFQEILRQSVALTCAANSINRSMGIPDVYPFVIPQPAVEKLTFIHHLLSRYS